MFLTLSSSALVSWFLIYCLFWFLMNLFTSKFISLYFIVFSVFWSFNNDSFVFLLLSISVLHSSLNHGLLFCYFLLPQISAAFSVIIFWKVFHPVSISCFLLSSIWSSFIVHKFSSFPNSAKTWNLLETSFFYSS